MENDNNTENLDSPNEEAELDAEQPIEDIEAEETLDTEPEVDVARLQETNKKLFERAKKAEADLKKFKSQPVKKETDKKPQVNNQPTPPNVEEVVLEAQGVDADAIAYLKKISQVNGTSLIKAQQDELYLSWKENREKKEKSEKARLGAARGSGKTEPKKDFSTPGLSAEDHQEMWKREMGLN